MHISYIYMCVCVCANICTNTCMNVSICTVSLCFCCVWIHESLGLTDIVSCVSFWFVLPGSDRAVVRRVSFVDIDPCISKGGVSMSVPMFPVM